MMNRALHIDTSGTIQAVTLDPDPWTLPLVMNDALESEWYDVTGALADGIQVFYDMYGADRGRPVNETLSAMLQRSGTPMTIHGPGIVFALADNGRDTGLTDAQTAMVVSAWCTASETPRATVAHRSR